LEVLDPERPSEDEDETSRDIKGLKSDTWDESHFFVGVEPGLKRHI
jgi:hypothetical protein